MDIRDGHSAGTRVYHLARSTPLSGHLGRHRSLALRSRASLVSRPHRPRSHSYTVARSSTASISHSALFVPPIVLDSPCDVNQRCQKNHGSRSAFGVDHHHRSLLVLLSKRNVCLGVGTACPVLLAACGIRSLLRSGAFACARQRKRRPADQRGGDRPRRIARPTE